MNQPLSSASTLHVRPWLARLHPGLFAIPLGILGLDGAWQHLAALSIRAAQPTANTLLVGGLALDYCVKTTALQLRRAGFVVDVYLPACRAIAENTAQAACAEMSAAGIALHTSLDELDATLNTDKEI